MTITPEATIETQSALSDAEVARRGARGAVAYVFRSGASQIVQAASALAVAHVLAPSQYGAFALALTLVAAVRMVGDFGITWSLAVERHINEAELRGGCAVALAVALAGAAIVSAVWTTLSIVRVAGPGGVWIVPALCLTLLVWVPAFPSTVLLERRLEFSKLGWIGVVQAVVLFSTQVVLLLSGAGIWGMVIAQVVGITVGSFLTVRASGRLLLPTVRAPIGRLIAEGIPFQMNSVATALTGTLTNLIVAAQLGARGIGLFSWCTILATPLTGAIFAVHGAMTPTLARMRRDDGRRYGESVAVLIRALGTVAAVGAGCVVGLTHTIVLYVFGARWLGAAAAVQVALIGTIPLALLGALQADANAQLKRRVMLVSSLAGGAATLATLVPLATVGGVGGAAAAMYLIGPAVGIVVYARGVGARINATVASNVRLFAITAVLSYGFGRLAVSPLALAAACLASTSTGLGVTYLFERRLILTVIRRLRTTN